MMAKDSVKKRLGGDNQQGMSFTEFSYQLLQGYDYLYLYRHKHCRLQLGGSDQWGNITTGTELIRRTEGGEAFALTCPLITKADGGKFGKTESGNVWLDRRYTSPYRFYQFWLNVSDADAEKYIKIFTTLSREEIADLVAQQTADPGLRPLQKRLAQEITTMVHSEADFLAAQEASQILFNPKAVEALHHLDEATLLDVMDGVPQFTVSRQAIDSGETRLADLLTDPISTVFPSKGEFRKMVQGGGVSVNKEKVTDPNALASADMLLQDKYILVQRGKKNFFLLRAE
jgi:tyrosyl-tRNA synthetase